MKIPIENVSFVCGGMVLFMRLSENDFFRSLGPLGIVFWDRENSARTKRVSIKGVSMIRLISENFS